MSVRQSRHPLTDAVAAILPGPYATALLRASLDGGAEGRRALEQWLEAHPDPVAALTTPASKWLMPLVFRACVQHRVTGGAALQTVLKAAVLREELRVPSFRMIRDHAIDVLRDAGADPVVVRGAALGELFYPDLSLRHTHDVELVVERLEWPRAVAALSSQGFKPAGTAAAGARVELTHASGLPLVLHRRPFRVPFYNASPDEMLARAERVRLGRTSARVLSPGDAILHGCGQAVHSVSRDSLRWIVDAWFALDRRPDVDWTGLIATARARHLTLPAAVMLGYLGDALAAPVPAWVCQSLESAAAIDRSVGPELALYGARAATGIGALQLVRRTRSTRARMSLCTQLALPSPRFLAWVTRPRSPWLRTTHRYVFRPLRSIERRRRQD